MLSVLVYIISGCGRNPVNSNGKRSQFRSGRIASPDRTRIIKPENDQMFTIGEVVIALVEKVADTVQHIDSVEFYFDGAKIHTCQEEPYRYAFKTADQTRGNPFHQDSNMAFRQSQGIS